MTPVLNTVVVDLPNIRTFVSGDTEINLHREDPYGLWRIEWAIGRTPADLVGQRFTTPQMAENALASFLQKKDRVAKPKAQANATA